MDNNRLGYDAEKRLTRSIEKAASLALVDEKRDRNELLAHCLLGDGIDGRLAKTASRAFNKRLSVLTFQHTPDDKRAESFGISDPDKVSELMGASRMGKTASVKYAPAPFICRTVREDAVLRKTASAKPVVASKTYEETVDAETYERHIVSIMEKLAAEHQEAIAELRNLEGEIARDREAIQKRLVKTADFELQTLCNVYGKSFEAAFDQKSRRGFVKTAGAVNPGTDLFNKVGEYLGKLRKYARLNNEIAEFQDGIEHFSEGAAEIGRRLHKVAAISTPGLVGGIIGRSIYAGGEGAIRELGNIAGNTRDALRTGFNNAAALMQAAGHSYINPADVLDAKLITMEKYFDYSRALADMLADKNISKYPARQVINAMNDLMYVEQLRDPRNRLLLKAQLLEALARNGMHGNADLAQLGTILEHMGKAKEDDMSSAVAGVRANTSKREEKAMPQLEQIVPKHEKPKKDIGDILKETHELNKDSIKEWKDDNDKEEKKQKDAAEAKRREREQVLRAMGVRKNVSMVGGTPTVDYYITNTPVPPGSRLATPAEIQSRLDAYTNANP